jgi:PAS domain-containing protein
MRRIAQSETALEREKEMAQVTLHSIGDGVITLDARRQCRLYESDCRAVHGLEPGRSNRPAARCGLPGCRRSYRQAGGRALANEAVARIATGAAIKLLARSGKACAVRDSSAPINNGDGNLVGWVVVFHDVSQIQENGTAVVMAREP